MGRQYSNRSNNNNQNRNNAKINELEATIQKARALYIELRKENSSLKAENEQIKAEAEMQKEIITNYKKLYLDELQKRLDLAEAVRRLEENFENQRNCQAGEENRDTDAL